MPKHDGVVVPAARCAVLLLERPGRADAERNGPPPRPRLRRRDLVPDVLAGRVKYRDADGRQVQERLRCEPDWNQRKAERMLGARLAEVEGRRRRSNGTRG